MKLLNWVSTIAIAGALVACGKDEPPPLPDESGFSGEMADASEDAPDFEETIKAFEAFADEAFLLQDGSEAGFDELNEALPDLVTVSWDEKSFDDSTGATALTGLAITINTDPAFGLRAEEARLWGFDEGFLAARLRGEQLDVEARLFDRLEAENLSYFGVADAAETLFDSLAAEAEDDDLDSVDFALDTFEVTANRMVVSNLTLRPYEFAPAPDSLYEMMEVSEDEIENVRMAVGLAQQALAVMRTVAMEDAVVYDAKVDVDIRQGSADEIMIDQKINADVGFYGYEDVSGFDVGRAIMYNVRQSQSMAMTSPDGTFEDAGYSDGINYKQEESTQFFTYEDLQMDKLAGFLARGDFPSMDEKDLMSLGMWTARDYTLKLNDGEIFTAERVNFDGREFSWFIPNKLELDVKGASVALEEIGNFALTFVPDAADENPEAADAVDDIETALGKLDEYDLDTIPFDLNFTGTWDDASGAFEVRATSESAGFGEGDASFRMTLPDYGAVQTAMESDDKESAFEDAFQNAFEFKGLRFFEKDDGGYDKLFGYAIEVGKLYPQEGWGAMVGSMTPEQIRQYIATAIRSMKNPASQEVAQAAEWLESMALYYETSGGSLEIVSDPTTAIDFAYLDDQQDADNVEQTVEDMGISVTYSPE
ncbi:hypothetical protein WNY37_06995 [Henriciella sp. AS95]|uniref:hypothetical protein n=1 Tax=Henriciella sp. AS95 TaxID=3135782 RepID=UPI0031773755